jgi:hypothetical protein
LRRLKKAILRPSGDHEGPESWPGLVVKRRSSPPSAFMT